MYESGDLVHLARWRDTEPFTKRVLLSHYCGWGYVSPVDAEQEFDDLAASGEIVVFEQMGDLKVYAHKDNVEKFRREKERAKRELKEYRRKEEADLQAVRNAKEKLVLVAKMDKGYGWARELLIKDTAYMGGISVKQAEAEFDAALESGKLVRPDFFDEERYVHCDFVDAARRKDEELNAEVAELDRLDRLESMQASPRQA